ncbi:hypothetical protein BRC68_17925 [Halobacteriales archaeon QH_6_64_20]|nr:MAG: hypothetical protein BRC68_17925 [Halobacteriales archaeon QH_6_64_20]
MIVRSAIEYAVLPFFGLYRATGLMSSPNRDDGQETEEPAVRSATTLVRYLYYGDDPESTITTA